jgi:hypothetical protein
MSVEEDVMTTSRYSWVALPAVCALVVVGLMPMRPSGAQAQSRYPIMDDIANKIIAKYQNSTCEQLWERKSQHAPPNPEEQRVVGILRGDPQMRAAFIDKIAPPIANKMFDCAMIP